MNEYLYIRTNGYDMVEVISDGTAYYIIEAEDFPKEKNEENLRQYLTDVYDAYQWDGWESMPEEDARRDNEDNEILVSMTQEEVIKESMKPFAESLHSHGWKKSGRSGEDGFGYEEWFELSKEEADAVDQILDELDAQ